MKSETRWWVKKAESDLRVARREAAASHPERDIVCFLCQQCAEKDLKAILCERSQPIRRTHDLIRLLLDLLSGEGSLRPLRRFLRSLTRYAVEYRYPYFAATTRQMAAALRHAERVRHTVRTILGLRP
jgi:HEPN domain-containing protein